MWYKEIENGHIICVGTGMNFTQITVEEYNTIMSVIRSRPVPPDGYDYVLKTDLTWELVELPPMPETEPTTDEVIDYLFGGDAE